MTEKIHKILSHFGYGSRRNIEKMIESNSISINGKPVTIGQRLEYKNIDYIIIKGKRISIKKKEFKTKVIIYNKPEGEVCTRYESSKTSNGI